MAKLYINKSGGVIQEVISDDADIEVYLVDFDNNDSENLSALYTELLDKPEFENKILQEPEFEQEFIFQVELSGTGYSPELAWNEAVQQFQLDPGPAPDAWEAKSEEKLHIVCAVCGKEEDVAESDLDHWYPEAYIGEVCVGSVCESCVGKYGSIDNKDAVLDLDIKTMVSQLPIYRLESILQHLAKS
jgi:hypothetical protein